MADTSEIIRKISIPDYPINIFIRGGRIYVARLTADRVSVYNYAGEHIKDIFSMSIPYGMEEHGGRIYMTPSASGPDQIEVRQYDGTALRTISLTYSPRDVRVRYGRLWTNQHEANLIKEYSYDGTFIRSYPVNDRYGGFNIYYGRFYNIRDPTGRMAIANKGGEIIEERGSLANLKTLEIRGGRFYSAYFGHNEIYVVHYAFFNKL